MQKYKTVNLGKLSLVTSAAIFASTGLAATVSDSCPDIPTCAKVVGELLGQHYVLSSDVKGKVSVTPALELTKENAETVFTNLLFQEGYSRIPLGIPNAYQIMRQRDARDQAIPLVKAAQNQVPNLPATWDLFTLSYKATHPEVIEHIARSARSFMPANSRIIPSEINGTLFVTDSAMNLKKLYEIIADMDRRPTSAMKKEWVNRAKERRLESKQAVSLRPGGQEHAQQGLPQK